MNQINYFFTVKNYFILVLILSLFGLGLFIKGQTEWLQQAQERLGLKPMLEAKPDSFYNNRIDPIFEKYCAGCHNDNKQKGHLRLDSFRQLNFSGRSGADLTQAENNLLLERMLLPAEDRLAMPPYGRDRHSNTDIELITLWLNKGASGELKEADFPNAPAKVKEIKFAKFDSHKIKQLRAPLSKQVLALQQNYPLVLQYQARTSANLIFDAFSIRNSLTDLILTEFESVKSAITQLDISHTQVTDKSLALILSMTNLRQINVQGSNISNLQIADLSTLPKLNKIIVNQAQVNKSAMDKFAELDIQIVVTHEDK